MTIPDYPTLEPDDLQAFADWCENAANAPLVLHQWGRLAVHFAREIERLKAAIAR